MGRCLGGLNPVLGLVLLITSYVVFLWTQTSNESTTTSKGKQTAVGDPGSSVKRYSSLEEYVRGATTSLINSLLQHPLVGVLQSEGRDHFFEESVRLYPEEAEWKGDLERHPDLSVKVTSEILEMIARPLSDGRQLPETKDATMQMVVLDRSPRSLMVHLTPYRMSMVLPHAKIVVLLRDPTDRYFSHLRMVLCDRKNPPTQESVDKVFHGERRINDYLKEAEVGYQPYSPLCKGEGATANQLWGCYRNASSKHSPLVRGLYADQLERWYRAYPREQVLVISAKKLVTNFQAMMQRILDFAGLPPHPINRPVTGGDMNKACNPRDRGGEVASMYSRRMQAEPQIRMFYKRHNSRLFKLIGEDFGWNKKACSMG